VHSEAPGPVLSCPRGSATKLATVGALQPGAAKSMGWCYCSRRGRPAVPIVPAWAAEGYHVQ